MLNKIKTILAHQKSISCYFFILFNNTPYISFAIVAYQPIKITLKKKKKKINSTQLNQTQIRTTQKESTQHKPRSKQQTLDHKSGESLKFLVAMSGDQCHWWSWQWAMSVGLRELKNERVRELAKGEGQEEENKKELNGVTDMLQ